MALMKTPPAFSLLLFVLAPLLLPAPVCPAQDTNAVANSMEPASTPPLVIAHNVLPVYHPPEISGGVLPIRVGGGSRGGANDDITIGVLVPDQVALTTRPQPSLYWYQSKPGKTRREVTLTEPEIAKPLLILQSRGPTAAGIHTIKLSDFKVKLKPNIVYQWSVAVVVDPHNRSADIVADGVIEYREPSPDLKAKLAAADDSNRAATYASAGIWYDALDALSALIAKNPEDQTLQNQRVTLLKQVGLNGTAIQAIAAVAPPGK